MAVDRPPAGAGGLPALAVAVNETLRKIGARRGLRLLRQANQVEGFDCPGCAWPEPATPPSRLAVCESGIRAIVDEQGPRRAGPNLFATYTVRELAARSDHWLNGQGRLIQPMILRPDSEGYEPIDWPAALELVARTLREHGDERALFYSSGRSSNEAAFLLQLLARRLGSNDLAHCSNLCHEGSTAALRELLGVERGTAGVDDLEAAQAVFCCGHNPGSNHPRMLASLRRARERGAKVVAVNPLRESGLARVQGLLAPKEWRGPGAPLCDL
ncbi:MAG: molybdopterin-dependent oxidoreductase, partial [Myxococcales bacterium]|nr:molybdopterin-dependent oxidoreductase [Myxococcales bacterium]